MTLASMINIDEDALICDLAETYHIYDYRSLPVKLVATLSAGLRDDARIRLVESGAPARHNTLLLAMIVDAVERFRYSFSEDAKTGANKPASILEAMFGEDKKQNGGIGFKTADELEAFFARFEEE